MFINPFDTHPGAIRTHSLQRPMSISGLCWARSVMKRRPGHLEHFRSDWCGFSLVLKQVMSYSLAFQRNLLSVRTMVKVRPSAAAALADLPILIDVRCLPFLSNLEKSAYSRRGRSGGGTGIYVPCAGSNVGPDRWGKRRGSPGLYRALPARRILGYVDRCFAPSGVAALKGKHI